MRETTYSFANNLLNKEQISELNKLIKKDGFKADMETNSLIEGENPTAMSKSIGLGMIDYSNALENFFLWQRNFIWF